MEKEIENEAGSNERQHKDDTRETEIDRQIESAREGCRCVCH